MSQWTKEGWTAHRVVRRSRFSLCTGQLQRQDPFPLEALVRQEKPENLISVMVGLHSKHCGGLSSALFSAVLKPSIQQLQGTHTKDNLKPQLQTDAHPSQHAALINLPAGNQPSKRSTMGTGDNFQLPGREQATEKFCRTCVQHQALQKCPKNNSRSP